MGVLIDTGILVEYERASVELSEKIGERQEEEFFISVITASELLHGLWRANTETIRARRTAFVETVLGQFPVLEIDLHIARVHAQIWAHLTSQGLPIGVHDRWIAATAIAHGLALATTNAREFSRVPGLVVESW